MSRAAWTFVALLLAGLIGTNLSSPATTDTSPTGAGDPGVIDLDTTDADPAGRLPIAPEDTGAHYDRDQWPHWSTRPEGCDTRTHMLAEQGEATIGRACRVRGGQWYSLYDNRTVTDPSSLDVDHIVPLAEVARSGRIVNGRRVGPRTWTTGQRQTYANDPAVLLAVTASTNRAKGDQDPAHWLPEHNRCEYVWMWVGIKHAYRLSADPAEARAINRVLARCPQAGDRR